MPQYQNVAHSNNAHTCTLTPTHTNTSADLPYILGIKYTLLENVFSLSLPFLSHFVSALAQIQIYVDIHTGNLVHIQTAR